ncbi:MAG: phosphotransferase, partial [Nocardioides sp.]
ERVRRALRGLSGQAGSHPIQRAGEGVLDDYAARPRTDRVRLIHGDWHLGQLGRLGAEWRLIDVDDLGLGDPATDLARPAAWWAAGLLDDSAWSCFLNAYRDSGGPGIPRAGDPWQALDLPARAATVVAASGALSRPGTETEDIVAALVEACAGM